MSADHEAAIPRALRRVDLARATGCNLETIRYYENVGLLPRPARTRAGHRQYNARDAQRLRFILRARELGFSIEAIRGLLDLVDGGHQTCAQIKERTARHLVEIRTKINDLEKMERVLSRAEAQCSGDDVPECPVLEALTSV